MVKKAVAKKTTKVAASKRKKPEDVEEVEDEEEKEEEVKVKGAKKRRVAVPKGKNKDEEKKEDEEVEEDKKDEAEVTAVLDKRTSEYEGTQYLVSYKGKSNEWVQISETEIPVPLIRAFESENKQRLWKKLDGLYNVNPTEKLTFTHKCCSECAKFGVYSAAENGNVAAIKVHAANFPNMFQTASENITKALSVALRKNFLDVVEYLLTQLDLESLHITVPIHREMTPQCLQLLCKIENFDLLHAATELYTQGNQLALASLLKTMKEKDDKRPTQQPLLYNITDLHIAALSQSKPQELPKPLNYDTIHANGLKKHITPLHLAALNPHPEILKALVDAGGDLTYKDDFDFTPGHYATISDVHGSPLSLQKDEGAEDMEAEEINEQEEEIERVSSWSAVLIRQRLNSLNLDNKGTKEVLLERLIAAIKKGKAIVFDFEKLIHEETKSQSHGPAYPAGTSKTFKWIVENKGFQEGDYQVVFNHAIQHDCAAHAQVVARILGTPEYRSSSLRHVCSVGSKALELYLKKLTVSLQGSSSDILAALSFSIEQRNVANVRRLLTFQSGFELKIELLEKAIEHKALVIAELLINEYKMAVNDTQLYRSLLHTAVSHGFLDGARLLIEKGANINEITDNGETALMSAARAKHPACVQLLVEKGVNVNPKKEQVKEVQKAEEDSEATDLSIPVFHNMVFVISGAFSRGMSYFYHILNSNGATCPSSVTKNITHLLLGATATTDYGGTTGKGSKKYREAMARKPLVVTEQWVMEQVEERKAEYRRKFGSGEQDVTGNILHDLFQNSIGDDHVGLGNTIEYLISIGVDLNILDNMARTVLHSLILYIDDAKDGGIEGLQVLLKHVMKDPKHINSKDQLGYNPILLAAALKKFKFLDCLLQQKGVALNEIVPIPPPPTKEEIAAEIKENQERYNYSYRNHYRNNYDQVDSGNQRKAITKHLKKLFPGFSLLHILCNHGHHDMIGKTISAGANPNISSIGEENARNPLICYAIRRGQLNIVKHLVNLPEVDVNAREETTGNAMLHILVASDHSVSSHLDTFLEKRKGAKFDLSATNKKGHTVLHCAIHSGCSPSVLRYLVKILQVDQAALDSAFRHALSQNLQEICIFLLDYGANIQDLTRIIKEQMGSSLNHVFYHVMHSPKLDLIDACKSSIAAGDNPLALKFLEDKAVMNSLTVAACGALLRSLFLHPTAQFTDIKDLKDTQLLVDKLLTLHPALAVIKAQNAEGNTALHIAIQHKSHIAITRKILESIAGNQKDVIALPNKRSQNCIHMAMYNRDAAVLELLLKADSSGVDAVDGEGKTPMQLALTESPWGIYIGSMKLIEVLMRGGADIFLLPKNSSHGTATSIASSYPPAISTPLRNALINVVHEVNAKNSAVVEAKITAAFEEGNKARLATAAKNVAAKAKRFAERKKKMDHLAAIKAKSTANEKKTLQKQGSTQVMASLATDKLNIPALGNDGDYEVFRDGDDIYDATLLSTDIGYNIFGSNKYLHIQLQMYTAQPKVTLKGKVLPASEAKYRLYTSTARIGDYSAQENKNKFYKLEEAKKEFEDMFYQKTQNSWPKRDKFERVKGCWNMMKKVYDVVIDEETRQKDYRTSDLPAAVKNLLYQITDLSLLRRTMEEAGIDWRMMPLGRLDKSQLVDGHEILRKLEQTLDGIEAINQMRGRKQAEHKKELKKLNDEITELSNEFYMRIPHNFYGGPKSNAWGYARPELLNSKGQLERKVLMLESLREVGAALELLYAPPAYTPGKGSLLDGIYHSLCVDISELPLDSPNAQMLRKYVRCSSQVKISNIFKVSRWAEQESFLPWKEFRNTPTTAGLPSNMLLFHGTQATNVLGILSQGLKIAPPEAPATGYMFGKGIYAANSFAKSVNYCSSHTDELLMFVCEVCVGEAYERTGPESLTKSPTGKHSTWGQGRNTPDRAKLLVTPKGVGVPLGPLIDTNKGDCVLNYDEFIVYDQTQVRLKYIIKFKQEFEKEEKVKEEEENDD